MTFWQQVEIAGGMGRAYLWILAGGIFAALVLSAVAPAARSRLRVAVILIFASFIATLVCGGILYHGVLDASATGYRYIHFASQFLFGIAAVNIAGVLLFRVILAPVKLAPAPILRDTLLGLAYTVAAITLLSRHGVDLSGIVATSAVVTAVIGFSLQDTLGNVMGGVALQMEQSIAVNDWIRVGEVEGVIREIRWRHTSIETRNWDTVVIPNSVLMKAQVTVLGRRAGQPRQHRAWVYFNVDFHHSPVDVIDTVERALQGEPIPNVAAEPMPGCILKEFKDSFGSYAVRYWLMDFAREDAISSEIRTRIFVALQRAGLTLAVPAESIFLTLEDSVRKERMKQEELTKRVTAMKSIKMFAALNDAERLEVAGALTVAPFYRGEIISHQGNEAHYLYILTHGTAEVRVANAEGVSRHVADIHVGDVFGEMGMMTGQIRTATVTALTDVECYRLDKESFQTTLQRRPEIAEEMSHLLAKRKLELDAIVAGLNSEALQHHTTQTQSDMLDRIRKFFLLD